MDKVTNPLFEKRRKQFGIGSALLPKKDLHRFIKWPKVAHIQRKRVILKQRLKSKAQLVVIAHDVDPFELVVWLSALCRKMEVPYCIVKGKSRLGSIVHKKTASVLCLTIVKNEEKLDFGKILEAIKANFNDKFNEARKKWGGSVMGSKLQSKTKAREKLLGKETAQRLTKI